MKQTVLVTVLERNRTKSIYLSIYQEKERRSIFHICNQQAGDPKEPVLVCGRRRLMSQLRDSQERQQILPQLFVPFEPLWIGWGPPCWEPRPTALLSVCMRAKSLQSCPTLCDSMDCGPPGSSVHGILDTPGKNITVGHHASSSRSSQLRDQTSVSYVSCTGRQVLYH